MLSSIGEGSDPAGSCSSMRGSEIIKRITGAGVLSNGLDVNLKGFELEKLSAKFLNVAQNAGRLEAPAELQQEVQAKPNRSDVYESIGGMIDRESPAEHGETELELFEDIQINQATWSTPPYRPLDPLQDEATAGSINSSSILNHILQLRAKINRQRPVLRSVSAIFSRRKIIFRESMTRDRYTASNEPIQAHEMVPEQRNDEEAQNDELEEPPWNNPGSIRRSQLRLCDKLFGALATAICILNITAGLFHVMLMNDPSPPKWSDTIGSLTNWILKSVIMAIYGVLRASSMKGYVSRMLVLAMLVCIVVGVLFPFAGAANFASSVLIGMTVAMFLWLWLLKSSRSERTGIAVQAILSMVSPF